MTEDLNCTFMFVYFIQVGKIIGCVDNWPADNWLVDNWPVDIWPVTF